MKLKIIPHLFSVCKLRDFSQVDISQDFCFIGKTDQENSLVCPTDKVPESTLERDDGWQAFRIEGVLDFSLVGILSKISSLLADQGISIFALSTFNTDYILVKKEQFKRAMRILDKEGYAIEE